MSEFEFDTPDIDTNVSDLSDTPADDLEDGANPLDAPDDDFYHAEHMSDEEVKRIDEMWNEAKDYSDVEPYKAFSSGDLPDIDDLNLTDEEKFAATIESMSLDDLQIERDRLEELSKMSDMDIFAEYDEQGEESNPGGFEDLVDGLSKEELTDLRDKLESKDPETLELMGIDGDTDDNPKLVLKKK